MYFPEEMLQNVNRALCWAKTFTTVLWIFKNSFLQRKHLNVKRMGYDIWACSEICILFQSQRSPYLVTSAKEVIFVSLFICLPHNSVWLCFAMTCLNYFALPQDMHHTADDEQEGMLLLQSRDHCCPWSQGTAHPSRAQPGPGLWLPQALTPGLCRWSWYVLISSFISLLVWFLPQLFLLLFILWVQV